MLSGLIIGLALVAAAALALFWQQWQETTHHQRRAVVREAARWAVLAAEWLHDQPRSGPTKLTWVLEHLRRRFPDLDDATLTRQAERAVRMLNVGKNADAAAHLNGQGPRHVE